MEKDIILLWYLMLAIDPKTKLDILLKYKSEENIYNNLYKLINNDNLSVRIRKKFMDVTLDDAKELKKWLNNNSIGYITYNDDKYPHEFYELDIPPYGFYYKGDISLLNRDKCSIVGSRRPSFYGLEMCSRISTYIAKNDIVIVSGLAQGIDSIAHKSALDANSNTIGVLGCGIDVIYPKANYNLYKKMEETDLIISEFNPKAKPLKFHFPMRNRLISALGKALVVIEASQKSGSLISANYSLMLNRDIIVVPGRVGEQNFEGSNSLIRDGALIYTDMLDLDLLLNIHKKNEVKSKKNDFKELLLNIIGKQPVHLDDIINSIDVDRGTIFKLLFEMQNEKEVICLPGNFYAKLT